MKKLTLIGICLIMALIGVCVLTAGSLSNNTTKNNNQQHNRKKSKHKLNKLIKNKQKQYC